MGAQAAHEQFEEHLLERERFMKGGRDTAIVVWLALLALVASFLLVSRLAGETPLPPAGVGAQAPAR
ncbi:MAG TPA: hypothetical protein VFQ35_08425 [Polyangiaceae bacterium]|nr:hypothetical protein [Polyangiaceae bacterium]